MTRIAVFAYSLTGYACLKALIDLKENITGVITHPDDATETVWFPSVYQLAKDHNIPVIASESPKDDRILPALGQMQPELLLSLNYRKMIPQSILDIPELGSINAHPSLLPRYRGRCPLNWALINGETETGVTFHHMVRSADAGNIVDQEQFPITVTDTAYDLFQKAAAAAVSILTRQLPALKEGRAPSLVQDDSQATYFGGRTAEDSRVDWRQSAWQIHNLIRAVPYPYFPSPFTYLHGKRIEIRANRLPEAGHCLDRAATPGQVIAQGEGFVRVACSPNGEGFIDITKLSVAFTEVTVGEVLS